MICLFIFVDHWCKFHGTVLSSHQDSMSTWNPKIFWQLLDLGASCLLLVWMQPICSLEYRLWRTWWFLNSEISTCWIRFLLWSGMAQDFTWFTEFFSFMHIMGLQVAIMYADYWMLILYAAGGCGEEANAWMQSNKAWYWAWEICIHGIVPK